MAELPINVRFRSKSEHHADMRVAYFELRIVTFEFENCHSPPPTPRRCCAVIFDRLDHASVQLHLTVDGVDMTQR